MSQLGGPASSNRAGFWARSRRGWDIAFYGMAVIGAVTLTFESDSATTTAITLTALGVLVVAYTLIGRRAVRTGDRRLAAAYLVVLVLVMVAIVRVNPAGGILLFIAYSQVWYFAESRRMGVAVATAMTIAVFGSTLLAHGRMGEELPSVLGQAVITLAFALLIGLWLTTVAEQSEERAELLARLQAAQAELAESHHAAGVLAERERMAREIHDTLAQGFTSLVMLAQTASADLARERPGQAADRLALIERTARENLAEARALVAASAPVGLETSTLTEALGRLARRFGEETGVRVEVRTDAGIASLGRDREVVLLRAAQEALSNVRRHADARAVELVLEATDGVVRLEVADDGRGMEPTAVEGFGLRGMRERVTAGGGGLDVRSAAGEGTRVRVTLPAGAAGSAADLGRAGLPAGAAPDATQEETA